MDLVPVLDVSLPGLARGQALFEKEVTDCVVRNVVARQRGGLGIVVAFAVGFDVSEITLLLPYVHIRATLFRIRRHGFFLEQSAHALGNTGRDRFLGVRNRVSKGRLGTLLER